ncbi:MAG: YbhN family protein, partial [Hyphomonadaceae bacterium]
MTIPDHDTPELLEEEEARSAAWRTMLGAAWGRARGGLTHPILTAAISLGVFIVALVFINNEMTRHSLNDLKVAFEAVNPWSLLAAVACVGLAFAAFTFNDRFALTMLGKSLPSARTARASIAAYALANSLGYSWMTAGTARLQLYRKWGLMPAEIGALSFLTGSAVQVGGLTAAALGLLYAAPEIALHGPFHAIVWYCLGLLLLVPAALWLVYARFGASQAHIGEAIIHRPDFGKALTQLGITVLEWMCAAGVLYFLLPDHGGWSYPAFL